MTITLYNNRVDWSIVNFKQLFLVKDEKRTSLYSYIKSNGYYAVHFENPALRYSNKQLFKDTHLLGGIDEFLKIFEEYAELDSITSEKGTFAAKDERFQEHTLFSFIEKKFKPDFEILVCDDLGTEWGDYIGINGDSVTIFAAKHKGKCFSASALQEVVGQAQKNLGSFVPLNDLLEKKKDTWSRCYNGEHVETTIKRVRTEGKTSTDAVSLWRQAVSSPNYRKDLYLVIDFLSKKELTDNLHNLRDEKPFVNKKEAVPLLWILSSLITSCKELNIRIHITCQK